MNKYTGIETELLAADFITTADFYKWFFKLERGEPLSETEEKRKTMIYRVTSFLGNLDPDSPVEVEELLSNMDLKRKVIKILEEIPVEDSQLLLKKKEHLINLCQMDLLNAQGRRSKIQETIKKGKKERLLKLLYSDQATSIHILEIFSAISEISSGFNKIDLINEVFWGIRSDLRTKNSINRKRDETLLEESHKILDRIGQLVKRIERIKTVEKLYILVQALKFPDQIHQKAECYVEKKGDDVVLGECPEILREIDETKSGIDKMIALKELYGITRVNSKARELVEKKWDIVAEEEFKIILKEIDKSSEGMQRLEAVREVWQVTRMGSSAESKIVDRWEKIISQEFINVLSEISWEKDKKTREEKINRLWTIIARFPEKRKAFKEILDQLDSKVAGGVETLDLIY